MNNQGNIELQRAITEIENPYLKDDLIFHWLRCSVMITCAFQFCRTVSEVSITNAQWRINYFRSCSKTISSLQLELIMNLKDYFYHMLIVVNNFPFSSCKTNKIKTMKFIYSI